MGLEYRPNLVEAHVHGRIQSGGELGGMVGKIVGNGYAVKLAQYLKAAMYAGEGVKSFGDFLRRYVHLVGHCRGSQRVKDVVTAGHGKLNAAQGLAFLHQGKFFPCALGIGDFRGGVVVFRVKTEGNHLCMGQAFYRLQAVGVVSVDNQQAAGLTGELPEGFDDVFQIFKIIQMVGIYIQNHGHRRMQLQKRVHILTGFTDHDIRFARPAVGADKGQLAADDGAGIPTCTDQQLSNHTGGSGFAVGAGNGDGIGIPVSHHAQQH